MNTPTVDWHVDYDRQIAVAYWLHGEWLVLYAFTETGDGVVDVAGFRIETYRADDHPALADRVQSIVEAWTLERPARGLTSAEIRTMARTGSLLSEARRQLAGVLALALISTPARRRRRDKVLDDRHYAELAVNYEHQLRNGPGARARLAKAYGITENTARDHIKAATKRGYWITPGRGRTGQATTAAYELAKGK